MPRRKREAPVIPSNSLVASAVRYPGKVGRSIYRPDQAWQKECYRHYAICGEARFAAQFFGSACSRAMLYAVEMNGNVAVPTPTGPAADALEALFNGHDGQTQMLEAIGVHLTIAGECFLVGRNTDQGDVWEIVSVLEVRVNGDSWSIDYGDGTIVTLTDDDVVIRIWMPFPAQRVQADSPFRSLLPILSEIEYLTRHVFAQVTSRLTGAGILMMPQGMTFPPPPETDGVAPETSNDADAFLLTLADAMLTPLDDPSSPAAKVPIVVTAPDDAIDKPRLLTFWTDLDDNAQKLRDEAIRRFALGMDLPPEQILGMGSNLGTAGGRSMGVSHWGAWQIEESAIKMHIEPMLDLVTAAITLGYLRPITEDPTDAVAYDTSNLRLRPDRSKEAFELYDRGGIGIDALLRETGFSPDDKMTDDETRFWLLHKVASGSATPDQVGAALAALGVDVGGGPLGPPRESQPPPSLEDHPTRPRTPAESALLAACEALVFRAMERAGNRLRQATAKPPGVPSYETHLFVRVNGNAKNLLHDAWSCAPQVLDGLADPGQVVPVLDAYCTALLTEQAKHDRSRLAQFLSLAGP